MTFRSFPRRLGSIPPGFTLIELVIVIALVGVLGAVLAWGLPAAVQGYDLVWARRGVVANARGGLQRMVSEIRLIPGAGQITSIAATNFQFQYPVGTAITYSLSGGDILRNSDVLINNVSALTFTYFDEDGSVATTPSDVHLVGINLTVDSPGNVSNYDLRTKIFIRNTGNDYVNFTSP